MMHRPYCTLDMSTGRLCLSDTSNANALPIVEWVDSFAGGKRKLSDLGYSMTEWHDASDTYARADGHVYVAGNLHATIKAEEITNG